MRRSRLSAILAALLLLSALASACGGAPPTETQSSQPTFTPTAASTPSEVAAAPTPCAAFPGDECELAPGVYLSEEFRGGLEFELEDAWTNSANEPDLVALDKDGNWVEIVAGPLRSDASLDELREHVASLQGITVTDIEVLGAVDGREAAAIDVTNEGDLTLTVFNYPLTDGSHVVEPGYTSRTIWIEGDDSPVLIALIGPTEDFEAYLEAVQPIVESIRFGGA